jgi:hypothetical protein
LCPRAYLRVPDHGDLHLVPYCGYLPWRSSGLNTDSWRPPWGHRHDQWVNSKDIHLKINVRQRRRDELAACSSTTRRVLVSRFNLLSAIGIHDRFDPDAVSWRNLKEPTTCARVRSRGSIWSRRVSRKKIRVRIEVAEGFRPAVASHARASGWQDINPKQAHEDHV